MRRDQRQQGFIWFATYDESFIMEDRLRAALGSSFPKVYSKVVTV